MYNPHNLPEITVQAFAHYRQDHPQATDLQLIDVREPDEAAIAAVAGFTLYPLSQFGQWSESILTQLDPHQETIVMCHHGVRSAQMCQWLISQGFTQVKNLAGGIDSYSNLVDPTVPRY
jgi:rhodanese-related sulfurtransferase